MLRRITLFTLFGFLFTVFSTSALAQDCDAASLSGDLADFSDEMDSSESVSSVLDDVAAWLAERQDACADIAEATETPSESAASREPVLLFTSEEEGNQPVLGPIEVPDGVYRVRVVTDGYFIAKLEVLEGECGTNTMFNLSQGRASEGAEILFAAEGCEALISISNVTEDWTLGFYPILEQDITPALSEYSSETLGLAPLIGPVQFEDGRYKVTAETEGYMIVRVIAASGNCEPRSSLFNLSSGQASEGAQALLTAEECVGFITIDNVTEDWTLTFEPIN
jgi:hypothetical protein